MTDHLDRSSSDRRRQDPRLRERAVYVISVAAELAQVHPQTLRSYERAGLIEPARTPGGDRRYSDTDLDRVSRITELSEQGINLTGIGRILDLEAQVDQLETELEQARRQLAALAPHNCRGSSQLVPTRQGLVPWRHPLDSTIPTGGA